MEELYQKLMEHRRKTEQSKTYNIFETTGIINKETIICRFLENLLNPKGIHKLGSIGLKLFMKAVFGEEKTEEYYRNFSVSRECSLDSKRRIDIVIEGDGRFIPIEVKINAEDRKSQCYDYLEYAREIDSEAKIVYLTKDGRSPSKESMRSDDDELKEDDVICISFKTDIVNWIKSIISETGNDLNGILTQYIQIVEREYGVMEQEEKKILKDYIMENEKHFFTALKIGEMLQAAKSELLFQVFEDLEKAMDEFIQKPENKKYNLRKETEYNYYEYKDQIDKENGEYGEDPGINYVFEHVALKAKRQAWLRIELDNQNGEIIAGLLIMEPSEREETITNVSFDGTQKTVRILHEIQGQFNLVQLEEETVYLAWKYLPIGLVEDEDGIGPDFVEMNQAAIELINTEKRKEMVKQSIEVIREMLEELNFVE